MATGVQHRIVRISGIIILFFLVLIGWQSYWHLAKSDWLLAQPSNRRMGRIERNIPRGTIFDRNGVRLAWSEGGTRQYADARTTAAVLGYIDPVYGRVGIEGDWDLELAGLSTKFTADDLHRLFTGEKPHGKDLALTLDLRLQQAACEALGTRRGAVVVLDPATGGILAMATSPTFDPTTLAKDYPQLLGADDGALRNRATQDLYPPGSTMKLVTASAALMNGVDPATKYTCLGETPLGGTTITDYHGERHGTIAMTQALAESCNYYFARTAVTVGQKKFFTTAQDFGFNQHWWTQLGNNQRILPFDIATSSLAKNLTHKLPLGEFAQMGFGQATIVATPLQMAMVSAAIANKGTLMAPYLVAQLRQGGTEDALQTFASTPIGYPLDAEHANQIATMMRRVVTAGTGVGANMPGITVYGKTGTAQQTGGDDHAWFIGFADQQRGDTDRRIAFAVLIERGGTGGRIAVPVATHVLEAWKAENK